MDICVFSDNRLVWHDRTFPCALGRGGTTANKHEGDGATPLGRYPLRRVFYRPDRHAAPATGLATHAIDPNDGWCDDPARPEYNTHVILPFPGSHEIMWRDDGLYDVVVELGYNDAPAVAGMGSAIFMHVAKPDYGATEGCVALAIDDLLEVLAGCGSETYVNITQALA